MRSLTPYELEPGMILAAPIVTPSGQVLALEGNEVTTQLINRMKLYQVGHAIVNDAAAPAQEEAEEVEEVTVEEPAPEPAAPTRIQDTKTNKQRVAASSEFQTFQMQYALCMEELKTTFREVADEGKPLETDALMDAVGQLFRSRNTITELFDMLNNLHSLDDSVYAHSINVALISRMIGRWLKMDRASLDTLTIAGLLHDIGKVRIPEEVLNKQGKLTDEEFALIKKHPRLGYDILKKQNIDPRIKKAALMHHERCDGSGYPSNLEEDLIDEFAMIVGIADVYDAMTAARAYRAPLCAFQVISNFEKDGYSKYHTKFLLTFLRQIALTYQSNRVMLNDGRACNIVMLNPNDLSRPVVQFDDNECLDLSTNRDLFITAIV